MEAIRKLVVCGDTHIPFHDPFAIDLLFKFLKRNQPDTIVLNGDIIDCYKLFKTKQSPIEKGEFANEVRSTREFLSKIREICPSSEIIYIEGNHEFRLRKYLITQAPELYRLFLGGFFDDSNSGTLMDYLLNCHKHNVKYVPLRSDMNKYSHNYIEYHGIFIGHFDKINKNGGYTARALRDDLGVNIIQSHSHRIGSSYKTCLDGMKFGFEIGCLCDDPSYQNASDWQKGFLFAYVNEGFFPYQIVIDEKIVGPDGKEYK